jgi:hypothetical protein
MSSLEQEQTLYNSLHPRSVYQSSTYVVTKTRHTGGATPAISKYEVSGPVSLPKTSLTVPEFIHLLFAGWTALANVRDGKRLFPRGKMLEMV